MCDPNANDECCSVSGASATNLETLTSTKRSFATNGCPGLEYCLVDPNVAAPAEETYTVPAYPPRLRHFPLRYGRHNRRRHERRIYILLLRRCPVRRVHRLGLVLGQSRRQYVRMCSGHSTGFNQYHYHIAPTCLLNDHGETPTLVQNLEAMQTKTLVALPPPLFTHVRGPQIGWSFDWFPIYAPRGPNCETGVCFLNFHELL